MKTTEEKAKDYALKMYPILDERYDKHLPQSDFRASNEEAYMEGYNEAMRWRSVNDEMPKRAKNGRTSERILVKIKDWDKIELMWLVYVDKDDDDASYWTNDDDYWVDADIEVEFWRPIE